MCLQSTPCLNVVKILVLAFFLNGCHDKNMFCNNIDNYYECMHNVKGFCVQLMIKKKKKISHCYTSTLLLNAGVSLGELSTGKAENNK